jgi:hypothetical protein
MLEPLVEFRIGARVMHLGGQFNYSQRGPNVEVICD